MKSTNPLGDAFGAALVAAIWASILIAPIVFFAWTIPTPFIAVPLSLVWAVFWLAFSAVSLKEL
jgi:hypothetical protein